MSIETIRQLKQEALIPKVKVRKPIPRWSQKRLARMKEEKELGTDKALDHFFEAMRKRCKGHCLFCWDGTTYKNDELWRIAIAHLLPKRPANRGGFPSVATNEKNWVELCWSCHTNFDAGTISWELIRDSHEWLTIKEQLLEVLPLVAENERGNKLYSKLINLVYE